MSQSHAPADSSKYYLPHGTPWPIIGSVALFTTMLGVAAWLNEWFGPEVFAIGLALLAEKFQGARLGSANAAYIMMYALGMMAGPPALGLGLDLASPRGMFDALALFFALYLALIAALAGPFPLGKRRGAA